MLDDLSGGHPQYTVIIGATKIKVETTWIFGDRQKWNYFINMNIIELLNTICYRIDKRAQYKNNG